VKTVIPALQALRYGYELADADIWKATGAATAAVTGFLSALAAIAVSLGWFPAEIPPETIMGVSSGIVALVSTFLGYLQIATSKRVGMGTQPKKWIRLSEVPAGERILSDEELDAMINGPAGGLTDEARQRITDEIEKQFPAPDARAVAAARGVLPSQPQPASGKRSGPLDAH
jgi:hypothetical protein